MRTSTLYIRAERLKLWLVNTENTLFKISFLFPLRWENWVAIFPSIRESHLHNYRTFPGFLQTWRQQNICHTQGHHGRICFKRPTHYSVPKNHHLQAIPLGILFFLPYSLLSVPNRHMFFSLKVVTLGFKTTSVSGQHSPDLSSYLKQPKKVKQNVWDHSFEDTGH